MKALVLALVLTTTLTAAALAGEPVTSTGAARPGPVALTEAQMDTITAGGGGVGSIDPGCGGCSDATRHGGRGIGAGKPIEDAVGTEEVTRSGGNGMAGG